MNKTEEIELCIDICIRAEKMGIEWGDRITLMLDLKFTNQSCPLDLQGLLEAQDVDFVHDICGIQRHINRETTELEDFFVPRYAKRSEEE